MQFHKINWASSIFENPLWSLTDLYVVIRSNPTPPVIESPLISEASKKLKMAKKDKKGMKVPKNLPTTFITAAAQRPHSDEIWLQ